MYPRFIYFRAAISGTTAMKSATVQGLASVQISHRSRLPSHRFLRLFNLVGKSGWPKSKKSWKTSSQMPIIFQQTQVKWTDLLN